MGTPKLTRGTSFLGCTYAKDVSFDGWTIFIVFKICLSFIIFDPLKQILIHKQAEKLSNWCYCKNVTQLCPKTLWFCNFLVKICMVLWSSNFCFTLKRKILTWITVFRIKIDLGSVLFKQWQCEANRRGI